ncbi:MAG: hypothetical protein CL897_05215 [Dehalococcoidia bacterium]|nr:hypothetical protein [Dehalococcoidia bacterium]HCV00271.1 hypothetical protein [Dehalococcoidia bacterium]|tara:strand:- start:188 stop:667 length:480 start_codon:yes stop_codon:yes gene_type:complete
MILMCPKSVSFELLGGDMPAQLTPGEVNEFLDSRPGWITFTSIGKDGYPHSVPIGYFRVDDDVYIGCRDRTQKVLNAQRNSKVSLSLESGNTMQDIKGILIQGDATVINTPDEMLELTREAARRRGAPEHALPTQPPPGAAYIKVTPTNVISWDYARPG